MEQSVRATRVRRLRIRRAIGRSITAAVVFTGALFVMDIRASTDAGTSVPATIESSPADWATPLPDADGGVWAEDSASSDALKDAKGSTPTDRKVRVVVLGKDHDVKTDADTVRQLLTAMGIQPDANDRVTPPPSTPIRKVNSVRVIAVTFQRSQTSGKVDPETVTRVSDNLKPGESKIVQKGRPGVMVSTYRRQFHDGVAVGKPKLMKQTWSKPPVDRVKLIGAKADPAPTGGGGGGNGGGDGGGVVQSGMATWYRVDGDNYTAASTTFALGTRLIVTNTANGKSITVMVNDHGPYSGAVIDLSDNAFAVIAPLGAGAVHVNIERAHGDSSVTGS